MAAADNPPTGGGDSAGGANSAFGAQATAQVEAGTDEDEQKEAGPEAEEKGESPAKAQPSVDNIERETFPAAFDDLCLKFAERANFLLEVILGTYVDGIHQPVMESTDQ